MLLPRLEQLVAGQPLETDTAWYAVDASVWPRCDAETSSKRGYYHHHTRHSHGQPIVAGWNYSWLVQVPERCSSWTAQLAGASHDAGENVNQVAAEQLRSFLSQRGSGQPRPIFTCDAGYEPVQLGVALAGLDVCALVRLRSGRCFYADPPQGPTGGRTLRHGAKFVCDDPTTWPCPAHGLRNEMQVAHDRTPDQASLPSCSGNHQRGRVSEPTVRLRNFHMDKKVTNLPEGLQGLLLWISRIRSSALGGAPR